MSPAIEVNQLQANTDREKGALFCVELYVAHQVFQFGRLERKHGTADRSESSDHHQVSFNFKSTVPQFNGTPFLTLTFIFRAKA